MYANLRIQIHSLFFNRVQSILAGGETKRIRRHFNCLWKFTQH